MVMPVKKLSGDGWWDIYKFEKKTQIESQWGLRGGTMDRSLCGMVIAVGWTSRKKQKINPMIIMYNF